MKIIWALVALFLSALSLAAPAIAAEDGPHQPREWSCLGPPPAQSLPTRPIPRVESWAVERYRTLTTELVGANPRVVILGDSLTQRWDPEVWDRAMAPRGAVNLGINGDRVEHLAWRIRKGNLPASPPALYVVLIGTNNVGRGHPLPDIADGMRLLLENLRAIHPTTPILLLALPPRADRPDLTIRVQDANRFFRHCAKMPGVAWGDPGAALLDNGKLSRAVAPDGLHFSALGYERLTAALVPMIDRILEPQRGRR
jgi:lysophospholipase L1-like esterase